MLLNGLFALVVLIAVLLAIAFFMSARSARAELAARGAAETKLRNEAEVAAQAAAEARAEGKERREELTQLRSDLERTKKKAFDQLEAAKRAGGAQALREELDRVTGRLAEARTEADHQRDRARTLEQEVEKARQAAARASELAAQLKARAEAPRPAPAAAPPPPPPPAPDADAGKLQAEKDRADKAEARLADAKKRVVELERDLKGARGRLETEKRVYIVQKGELELASDRYAELRRRHEALRKDHDELVEAVRQAAREERRLTQQEAARASKVTKPAAPEGDEDEALKEGETAS
jgi:colicin import membrane protein